MQENKKNGLGHLNKCSSLQGFLGLMLHFNHVTHLAWIEGSYKVKSVAVAWISWASAANCKPVTSTGTKKRDEVEHSVREAQSLSASIFKILSLASWWPVYLPCQVIADRRNNRISCSVRQALFFKLFDHSTNVFPLGSGLRKKAHEYMAHGFKAQASKGRTEETQV